MEEEDGNLGERKGLGLRNWKIGDAELGNFWLSMRLFMVFDGFWKGKTKSFKSRILSVLVFKIRFVAR